MEKSDAEFYEPKSIVPSDRVSRVIRVVDAEFYEPKPIAPCDRVSRVIRVIDDLEADWRKEGEEELAIAAAQFSEALRKHSEATIDRAIEELKKDW